MEDLIVLYIIISYPIVLGYTLVAVRDGVLDLHNINDRLIMVFFTLLSPLLFFVLLGSLLYKNIKE